MIEEALHRIEELAYQRPRCVAGPASDDDSAYIDGSVAFLLAIGFARMGAMRHAKRLVQVGQRTLADHVESQLALVALEARFAQACKNVAPEAPLPESIRRDYSGGTTLDRLVSESRIVVPYLSVDPWCVSRRRPPWITEPRHEDERLAQLIAALSRDVMDRADQLHGVLDEIMTLRHEKTGELLERVLELTATVEHRLRTGLYAKAVVVAEHTRRPDLVSESMDTMRVEIGGSNTIEALGWVLPVANRLALRRELAELLIAVETCVPDSEIVVAGYLAALGDSPNARTQLDRCTISSEREIRSYATACTQLPLPEGRDRIVALMEAPAECSTVVLVDTTVLALMTCARATATQPTPITCARRPSIRASEMPTMSEINQGSAVPACDFDPVVTATLSSELDHLAEMIESPRHRDRGEAPWELTRAYLALGFGYAFARVGRSGRALDLIASARGVLTARTDAVHDYLFAAYRSEIEAIQTEKDATDALERQFLALSRDEAYKVARLKEESSILGEMNPLDPIGAWIRGQRDGLGSELTALKSLRDPNDCHRGILALCTLADESHEERDRLCELLLVYACDRPRHANFIAERIAPILWRVSESRRALMHAMALPLFHDKRALAEEVNMHIRYSPPEDVTRIIEICSATLQSGALIQLLAAAALRLEQSNPAGAISHAHAVGIARLALATALVKTGSLHQAEPIFEASRAELQGSLLLPYRLALTRSLATAYSEFPAKMGLDAIANLRFQYPGITDSYATSTHFCLSVIVFVESLVVATSRLARYR